MERLPIFLCARQSRRPELQSVAWHQRRTCIVGYFGDGTVIANNGYVLVPKNHYSVENFTHLPSGDLASQTQAIGINNKRFPDIVGFYTDHATGFTHGFLGLQRRSDQLSMTRGFSPERHSAGAKSARHQ